MHENAHYLIGNSDVDPKCWSQLFLSKNVFEAERKKFTRDAWNLLCLLDNVSNENDWVLEVIGDHKIVVFRSNNLLKGFENICLNCGHQLYYGTKGNGLLHCNVCTANPLLRSVGIAICGNLVFGRICLDTKSGDLHNDLDEYLGGWAPIVDALTKCEGHMVSRVDQEVNANWKLCYQMTLDDYHLVQVHPATFGSSGYLRPESFCYFINRQHSALIINKEKSISEEWLGLFLEKCSRGIVSLESYFIFQIFPNIVLGAIEQNDQWFIFLIRYASIAVDRTVVTAWLFCAPGQAKIVSQDACSAAGDLQTEICYQDKCAAEHLQSTIGQSNAFPLLGIVERRISWFEDAYREFMLEGEVGDAKCLT